MASSKKIGSDKGSVSSLEKVKKEAEKLQSTLEDAGSVAASASPKQEGSNSLFAVDKTAIPNPSEPMDRSVLENIGIVGGGSNITSSSIASVTSLSDAHKTASKGSLLPDPVKSEPEKPKSSIQVNPTYKPAFESEEKAKLAASMDRPKSPAIGGSPESSLQSRLEKEQGNVYRASVGGAAAASSQQLGGGFRMASDPNKPMGNRMSSGSSYEGQNYGQPMRQVQSNTAAPQKTMQASYQTETVSEKSGKGMGAIGLIGGLLVAGGIGAVVMNPDLLSTTGISSNKVGTEVVSAPEALIPQATPSRPMQVQKASPVVAERKVAAVQVMPAPTAPAPAAPVAAKTNAVQSNTRFSETGKDVPLNLDASALKVKADQYIRIGGMPDGAELSSGVDMGDGNWLVAPEAVKGLKLTAIDGYKGTMDLYMQKIKDDARTAVGAPKTFKVAIGVQPAAVVAAPPKAVKIEPKVAAYTPVPVQPQPAPVPLRAAPKLPKLPEGISEANEDDGIGVLPTAKVNKYQRPTARGAVIVPARAPRRLSQGIPIGRTFSKDNYGDTAEPIRQERTASVGGAVAPIPQISDQRARLLLKRGNNLYRLGDLISARALYGQVAAGGNAEAAMAMGRTYDPIYFEKLGVQGFQPEPNRALKWYEKARSAGLAKAQGKIDNLNYYLKQ